MTKKRHLWIGGGVIGTLVVLALVAHFIVWNTSSNAVRSALIYAYPYAAATVNGERIRLSDYEERVADTRYYFDRQEEYGVELVERPSDERIGEIVMSTMIDTVLLEQIAAEYDVQLTTDDLREYYDTYIVTQEAGGADVVAQDLEKYYGWTPERFQETVLYPVVLREKIGQALTNDDDVNSTVSEKAQAVFDRAAGGESFDALAQEVSDDDVTKDTGGALGTITRGQMDAAFDEAVFSAAEGTIVGPVRSTVGYHIILVNEKDEDAGTAQVQHILVETTSVDELLSRATEDADIEKNV